MEEKKIMNEEAKKKSIKELLDEDLNTKGKPFDVNKEKNQENFKKFKEIFNESANTGG